MLTDTDQPQNPGDSQGLVSEQQRAEQEGLGRIHKEGTHRKHSKGQEGTGAQAEDAGASKERQEERVAKEGRCRARQNTRFDLLWTPLSL